MKKVLSLILCLMSVISIAPTAYAEEAEIEGLHENWSKLFLTNCFTEEQIAEMDAEYMAYETERLRTEVIPARAALGRMETDSEEEELALEIEEAKLDFDSGVRIGVLQTYKYLKQYADSSNFSYIFNGEEFWTVPSEKISDRARYNEAGEYSKAIGQNIGTDEHIIYSDEGISFLQNENAIKNTLIQFGESRVLTVKLFVLGQTPYVYIDGECQDYMAALWENNIFGKFGKSQLQAYSLYTANELIDVWENTRVNNSGGMYKTATKPTYETEATALQSEGLLYGNENGLDLLKPLTRIEAAAMLLRALGESETATADSVQVFSDVPSTHWGYGAASNAYNLGLIYGVGDNLFAPDKRVTATEFASMILRASGEQEFDWQQAINLLIERGIITQENADTMDFFTRGDMAKIIYEVRAKGMIG